jgi:stress response protein SCP2
MSIPTTPNIAALLSLTALLATAAITQAAEPAARSTATNGEQIEVYRPDGSVQCEPGGAIPLEQMRKTLTDADIVVHSQRKANDGLMRPAVCGAGTGAINVFSIDAEQLDAAIAQGFRPLLH